MYNIRNNLTGELVNDNRDSKVRTFSRLPAAEQYAHAMNVFSAPNGNPDTYKAVAERPARRPARRAEIHLHVLSNQLLHMSTKEIADLKNIRSTAIANDGTIEQKWATSRWNNN